ncbi:hypothetical protein BC826DRAFT_973078 [Russula brevipes]|nr:hypothetical protein BC826DRAFT_973078 [Russula brevipes]
MYLWIILGSRSGVHGHRMNMAMSAFRSDLKSKFMAFGVLLQPVDNIMIELDVKHHQVLDRQISKGYKKWMKEAPEDWKADDFITNNSPIIATLCYDHNVRILTQVNKEAVALEDIAWNSACNYAKITYLTFALTTSIKCTCIEEREPIPNPELQRQYQDNIYDECTENSRCQVNLETLSLLDKCGNEIQIFSKTGMCIQWTRRANDPKERPCGVLVNLTNIQALFHPALQVSPEYESSGVGGSIPTLVDVEVYPLYFLHTVSNIKVTGLLNCFYPLLTRVNKTICDLPRSKNNYNNDKDEDNEHNPHISGLSPDPIVFPVSLQVYNYITHLTVLQSGCNDIQHGSVTSALSGAFSQSEEDGHIANKRSIFEHTILPLARAWDETKIRNTMEKYLVVLKPEACIPGFIQYCHTGNTSVLLTSLMNPLGLSRGLMKDGFPMICRLFKQPMISMAMQNGLQIDPRRWPRKDGYPAVASKSAQVLTYSLSHFQNHLWMVPMGFMVTDIPLLVTPFPRVCILWYLWHIYFVF